MLDLEMYLFYIFNLSWSSIAATKWNTAVTKIHLFYLFFYFFIFYFAHTNNYNALQFVTGKFYRLQKEKEIKRKIIYMYLYTKIHLLLKASLARKIRHKV